MIIREEWMSGEKRPNESIIEDAKKRFELQKQSLEGKDAKIDDIPMRIVVQSHTNVLYQTRYDYKIHCDECANIGTGSIVSFDDKDWMVVTKIYDNKAYKTASVLQCNNNIIVGENIIPVCIESQTRLFALGITNNKFFETPDSEIMMMIPDKDVANAIQRNDIFKLPDNYKVVDLNKVIMPGIIVAKLNWCIEEPVIKDLFPPSVSPETGCEIFGADEIKFGQTVAYVARKYVAGNEVSADFSFSITGESKAYTFTASDNKCFITCHLYPYDIILRATESEGYVEKKIKLKSLL